MSGDVTSVIHPGSLSQLEPLPGGPPLVVPDTGVVNDMLQPAVSPISHNSSVEPSVTKPPFLVGPVDPVDDSLHPGSFPRSMSPTSVQSDGTFIVQLIGQGPVLRQSPILDR